MDSLQSLIKSIKELILLEELNISQNSFNQSFNFNNEELECVSQLGKLKDVDGFMNYRSYIIKHFHCNLRVLDYICITDYERGSIKTEEGQQNLLTINKVASMTEIVGRHQESSKICSYKREFTVNSHKSDEELNVYVSDKDISRSKVLKENKKEVVNVSNDSTNKENNTYKRSIKERNANIPLPLKKEFKVKNVNNKVCEKYKNVYAILKKTIAKLADPNGFIEILNLTFILSYQKQRSFLQSQFYLIKYILMTLLKL